MAKATADIRSLARSHTETAINTLAGIMNNKNAKDCDRLRASEYLLDRGWGRAPQALEVSGADGGPIVFETIYEK